MFRSLAPIKLAVRKFSSLSRLDLDIGINRVKDFQFRGEVTNRWSVGNAPNGGYLMMMAINAAQQCIEHPDPLSITAYYADKAIESHPVDIAVRIVTKARSSTTLHITMSQTGDIKSEYLAVFGNLDKFQGFSFNHKQPLSLPPRSDCIDCTKTFRKVGKHVKLFQELQVLLPQNDPFFTGLFQGKAGDKSLLNCWVKLEDPRKPCLSSLAFFLDALPPPVINMTPSFWVPTLELTVHFWSKPNQSSSDIGTPKDEEDDYWVQGKFETTFATNGLLYTDAEIWSPNGKELLATSRQYARVLEPKKQ